jgi:hypothetical protein
MVSGSQPPSNETPWPNLLKLGSGSGGIGVRVGTKLEGRWHLSVDRPALTMG